VVGKKKKEIKRAHEESEDPEKKEEKKCEVENVRTEQGRKEKKSESHGDQ